jgi:hypothetical protein
MPSDFYYTSFEEEVEKPFTDEHQPSFQNRRSRNTNGIGAVAVLFGVRETTSESADYD